MKGAVNLPVFRIPNFAIPAFGISVKLFGIPDFRIPGFGNSISAIVAVFAIPIFRTPYLLIHWVRDSLFGGHPCFSEFQVKSRGARDSTCHFWKNKKKHLNIFLVEGGGG